MYIKPQYYLAIGIFVLLFAPSCKKEFGSVEPVSISSLTVVNAVEGTNSLVTTFTPDSTAGTFFGSSPQIGFQSSAEYGIQSGGTPIIIYQTADSTQPVYSGNVDLKPHAIYSLFLSGIYNNQNGPDTLLVQDFPPYHALSDSTVGIRFINLCSDCGPVSVDIMGNTPGSEASGLSYKGITPFKNYAATSTIPDPSLGYVFEFRSAASDSLLASYTFGQGGYIPTFKNVTIALSGIYNPSANFPLGTFLVNNY